MASVTVGVGPISVTQDNAWDSFWNSVYNESTTFRNMPQSAKDAANGYKAELRTAITKQDPVAAKKALEGMAKIYEAQAKLVGGDGTEQGKNLNQLAKNCRSIGKSLTKENIRDLQVQRGTITQNSTGNDVNTSTPNSTTNQNDTILAMYTTDGTATGKINDVSKFKAEMEANGYTSDEMKSVLTTYYQNQGVAASELDSKVNDALASSTKQTASTAETNKNKEYAA